MKKPVYLFLFLFIFFCYYRS